MKIPVRSHPYFGTSHSPVLGRRSAGGWWLHGCLLVALALSRDGSALAGELNVDADTLFLAHFNASIEANYSQGQPQPQGMDVGFITPMGGKYAGGLAARVGEDALKEAGVPANSIDETSAKRFDGLRYSSQGNLDLQKGTFECWVRPFFSIAQSKNTSGASIQHLLFSYMEKPGRYFALSLNHGGNDKKMCAFVVVDGSSIADASKALDWEDGTWHHVAVTWDANRETGSISLFLDGQLARKNSLSRLSEAFPMPSKQMPYFCIGAWPARKAGGQQFGRADAVIDEVRISSCVRYQQSFELPQ